jgi:hypothetical protein
MKKLIILILILISLFINNFSFADGKCSNFKKLSKDYLKCLGGKIKSKTSNLGIDTSNPKNKKYLTDWFKKKK